MRPKSRCSPYPRSLCQSRNRIASWYLPFWNLCEKRAIPFPHPGGGSDQASLGAIGSYFSARISHESFHALFLNPPYLSVLGENGQTGRDEKRFLVNGLCHLMQGGQLVYIIPYYRLTADIARILCNNVERLSVCKFCGKEFQRFRQVAVLGIRKPRDNGSKEVLGLLRQVQGAVRKTLR